MRCVWGEWPCKAASEGIRTGDPRLEEGQSERDEGSTTKAVLEIAERGCDARTAAPSVQGRVRTGRVHATKRVGWSKTRVDVRQNKSGERERGRCRQDAARGPGTEEGAERGRSSTKRHEERRNPWVYRKIIRYTFNRRRMEGGRADSAGRSEFFRGSGRETCEGGRALRADGWALGYMKPQHGRS